MANNPRQSYQIGDASSVVFTKFRDSSARLPRPDVAGKMRSSTPVQHALARRRLRQLALELPLPARLLVLASAELVPGISFAPTAASTAAQRHPAPPTTDAPATVRV